MAPALGSDPLETLDVVQRVEHDVPDPGLERELELGLRLGVAVQVDARWIEAAAQRERELAARGDVTGESLLGEHAVDGGAGKRLGGEQHVDSRGCAPRGRVDEGTGAGAQVVLGDDESRRAELAPRARPRRNRRSPGGRGR